MVNWDDVQFLGIITYDAVLDSLSKASMVDAFSDSNVFLVLFEWLRNLTIALHYIKLIFLLELQSIGLPF